MRAPSSDSEYSGRVWFDQSRPCAVHCFAWFIGLLLASAPARSSTSLLEARDPLVSITTGCEIEGLEESFGTESLGSIGTNIVTGVEAAEPIDDQLEGLHLKSSESEVLATLGLTARTAPNSLRDLWLDFDSKAGSARQSVSMETSFAGREGAWSDWSLRNLLFWDRDEDDATSMQGLLYTRWRPRLGASNWRLNARGSLDVSRTDEVSLEDLISVGDSLTIPDSTGSSWLAFLNYQKVSVRLGLASSGLNATSLWLDLKQKWVADDGPGSYFSVALAANTGRFFESGAMLDLDCELQRRTYEEQTAGLTSFWEAELLGRWSSGFAPLRWKSNLRINGVIYDPEVAIDSTTLVNDDRLEIRGDVMLEKAFIDFLQEDLGARVLQELAVGCGPIAEVREYRQGTGSAVTLGGILDLSLRGRFGRSNWWFQSSAEGGHRNYREEDDSGRLTLSSFGLSLTQSDYGFIQLSLLCGGSFPSGTGWGAISRSTPSSGTATHR